LHIRLIIIKSKYINQYSSRSLYSRWHDSPFLHNMDIFLCFGHPNYFKYGKSLWNNTQRVPVQSTGTAATSRHLINRHHGLRRYDLIVSPSNAPKARRDGKTSRARRVRVAGDRGSPTRNVNAATRCYNRPCFINVRTTIDNRTTLDTPALVRQWIEYYWE